MVSKMSGDCHIVREEEIMPSIAAAIPSLPCRPAYRCVPRLRREAFQSEGCKPRRLARSVNFAGRHGIVWIWTQAFARGDSKNSATLNDQPERFAMRGTLDHKNVAVAVIYDKASDKFLLWHNKRWHGYAFPMKKFDPDAGDDPGRAAVAALRDWDMELNLSQVSASPLDRVVEVLFSDGTHRTTVYDYHVYGVDVGEAPMPISQHPDFRPFTFDELLTAVNVTSSTQAIARALVENRKVAVTVITRDAPRGREFLLVKNREGQYFFPASRMKDKAIPTIAACYAVAADLGYDAEIEVARQAEVPAVQESMRFGARLVQFYYHPCLVRFPGVD